MVKITKTFFLILILLATNHLLFSKSDFIFKFGGFSHHLENETNNLYKEKFGQDYNYNETHNGLGFDIIQPIIKDTEKHFYRYIFWYMKDSYNKDSFYTGLGYSYKKKLNLFDSILFNADILYMDRSKLISNENIYIENNQYKLSRNFTIKPTNFIAPMPSISVFITERFNLDFSIFVVPSELNEINPNTGELSLNKTWDTVGFIRFGYKF